MAARCTPHLLFPQGEARRASARASLLQSGQVRPDRPATLLAKFSPVNKVYEDQALGIVCYKDEHGEVICEGYDEGPRYSRQASPAVHRESFQGCKDLQIPDFPPLRQAKMVRGPGVLCINGFAAEEHDRH